MGVHSSPARRKRQQQKLRAEERRWAARSSEVTVLRSEVAAPLDGPHTEGGAAASQEWEAASAAAVASPLAVVGREVSEVVQLRDE